MKRTRKYCFWVVCAVVALGLSFQPSLMAEEAGDEAGAMPFDASMPQEVLSDELAPAPVAEVAKVERTADGKYYLDFKAASLITVLNVISNLSGINFVAGREVSDRQVNMTLDSVTLEDALQAIAHGCNISYDFLPGRNIYLFRASADSPEEPPLLTRVFKLYYVKASKTKEIEASSSSGGSSSSGSGSGGSSGSSGGTTGSGLITLKAPDEEKDLQSSAIVKAVEKILSKRGKVSVDDRSNSLVVTDSEDRLKMIESAIAQLDRALDQVLINVLLVETFENLDRSLGIEWGNATTGVFGTVTGSSETTEFPFRTGSNPTNGSVGDFFGNIGNTFKDTANQFNPTNSSGAITPGTRNFNDFRVQVKALELASKLKILAKPKILALDNQPALIKISTQTAIGTTSVTAAAGGSTGSLTEAAERAETGTILRVTPLINTGGRITLTVEPTFATADASAISVGGFASLDPTTRTARTTLMVNDGQTIALGGLLFSNQSNGNRKVPFFGNIPVIGKAFFTSNDKVIVDRELILFVTPNIISDPSMLETPALPERRLDFDDEAAPFWKVKQKEWYRELKDGPPQETDYDGYFNVRKKLIDSTLDTLDQGSRASLQGK